MEYWPFGNTMSHQQKSRVTRMSISIPRQVMRMVVVMDVVAGEGDLEAGDEELLVAHLVVLLLDDNKQSNNNPF
ncbi:unnamed protein product [Gongylonema pulchrum]|uniref:Uncharacterized protein n=1 Tax=Gongylonema pulchrum TaxID=637853 RepID=A0A183CXF1_9BILA|nr:unnamed protein product [Gongylonema pulchrum]